MKKDYKFTNNSKGVSIVGKFVILWLFVNDSAAANFIIYDEI